MLIGLISILDVQGNVGEVVLFGQNFSLSVYNTFSKKITSYYKIFKLSNF